MNQWMGALVFALCLGNKILEKYTEHRIYHFNHLKICSAITVTVWWYHVAVTTVWFQNRFIFPLTQATPPPATLPVPGSSIFLLHPCIYLSSWQFPVPAPWRVCATHHIRKSSLSSRLFFRPHSRCLVEHLCCAMGPMNERPEGGLRPALSQGQAPSWVSAGASWRLHLGSRT